MLTKSIHSQFSTEQLVQFRRQLDPFFTNSVMGLLNFKIIAQILLSCTCIRCKIPLDIKPQFFPWPCLYCVWESNGHVVVWLQVFLVKRVAICFARHHKDSNLDDVVWVRLAVDAEAKNDWVNRERFHSHLGDLRDVQLHLSDCKPSHSIC